MERKIIVAALVLLSLAPLRPAVAKEAPDAIMDQFFGIWDDDAHVTPQAVAALYAPRVTYYGQILTAAQVYANKRAFIRRWPDRRYAVVPGTVSKGCDATRSRCAVSVTLAYTARSAAREAAARGWTRVTLALARQDGRLKITRESGRPVLRP